jgi:outer membrane protein assembly factor BamB
VPASAGRDSKVVIRGISVAGQPVTQGQPLLAHVGVVTDMLAPLRLKGAANNYYSTPAISGDGTLFVPRNGSPDVLVFSADGTPLPSLSATSLGLSTNTLAAAFDDATATLLLASRASDQSQLVAVDAVSRAVCWSTGLEGTCFGIAVLTVQGLVVASLHDSNELRVHRLADGARVATVTVSRPTFIAADPSSATLYVSTVTRVTAFRWNGSALVSEGVVKAAGKALMGRPLAVMPPALGQRTSYLVVGTYSTSTLLVLSMSDRRLVHTHTLEGIKVLGLAADPSGTALAVCDGASKAIHVLPWPLPGIMPPLQ